MTKEGENHRTWVRRASLRSLAVSAFALWWFAALPSSDAPLSDAARAALSAHVLVAVVVIAVAGAMVLASRHRAFALGVLALGGMSLAWPALAGPVPLMIADGIANGVALRAWAAEAESFPALDGTRVVSSTSRVGLLVGNGNHCDFEVRLGVDASDLSGQVVVAEQLAVHYAAFWPPDVNVELMPPWLTASRGSPQRRH